MMAFQKRDKINAITLSMLPKEAAYDFKKSKGIHTQLKML